MHRIHHASHQSCTAVLLELPRLKPFSPHCSDLVMDLQLPHCSDLVMDLRLPHCSDLVMDLQLPQCNDLVMDLQLPH